MSTYRQDRTAEDIRREITSVIHELKDPRIAGHIISVVRTETANDLSYVKVYISALEGIDAAKAAVKALSGAMGLVRREIGKRLGLRKTPELKFIADNSIEHGMHIAKELSGLTGGKSENDEYEATDNAD